MGAAVDVRDSTVLLVETGTSVRSHAGGNTAFEIVCKDGGMGDVMVRAPSDVMGLVKMFQAEFEVRVTL